MIIKFKIFENKDEIDPYGEEKWEDELDKYEPIYPYINYYRCPDCDEEWEMEYDCVCDDNCPTCGEEIEPYETIDREE